MWILQKPELSDALKDIDNLIKHCNNLKEEDKYKFEQLYKDYDNTNGAPNQDKLSPLEDKKDIILKQYDKTTGRRNGKNNPLVYIREELMGQVQKCPYCSINQPQQLDHFMDKSTYGQLAVCRLNLVPLCSSCNHSKRDQPYKNFIHPYYQQFPKSQFFIAECQIIHGKICVNFRLDYNAFGNDTQLHDKLQIHLNSLNIMERFEKEANQFITELLSTCQISSNGDLQIYLNEIWEHYKSIYRLNDWRTAVIKGLIECPGMDISVVKSYQKTNYMINSIGA